MIRGGDIHRATFSAKKACYLTAYLLCQLETRVLALLHWLVKMGHVKVLAVCHMGLVSTLR